MKDTEFTVHAITDMYESLFYSFFGGKSAAETDTIARNRCPIPAYFKTHSDKCPAQALAINLLAEVQSESPEDLPEVKKRAKSYLLRSGLINFEKLDDIYTTVRDRRLNPQQREQMKEEILGIMDPQYLIAVHLYMKYHKIFDRELFDAFCRMIITGDRCSRSEEIPSYSFAALTVGEELVSEVMKCIFTTNGKDRKTPITLYEEVYADFLSDEREFPEFKVYEPTMKQFETHIVEVLNIAETEWNPENTKKNKAREFPKSIVNQYLKVFSKLVRKKVIVKLKTTSKQDPSKPNQRTMRSKINEIAKKFDLQVCKNNYPIDIKSCPDFLIDELWECLKKYGLKGHDSEKLEPDVYGIIDEKRVKLMGRLYIIVLLCYAFDKENYQESSLSFTAILNISVAKKNKTVRAMLRAYCELTDNADDQAIITELL